jgi:Carboxypeptidase regulatory-like domain
MNHVDRSRLILGALCFFTYATFLAQPARAQAVAVAQVEGQVLDGSGAIVPNAEIKITDSERGVTHTATTDKDGHYVLANLGAGNYKIEANAPGFEGYIQTGVVLDVGQNIQINVALKIGAVSSQVVVAGSANMVETRETTVSNVMDGGRVLDLPLNGRQATDLILLTGAAVTAPGGDQTGSKAFYSSVTISIAGGQSSGTNYLLDGAEYTDTFSNINLPFPFPDALQEFSVETSTLPARNGMHPGGVVNVVTKSGSNQFHGDLFEFLRNGDLNARNYFVTAAIDSLKRNQYGGTLGGRIVKNKVFFFGGYQGTRLRQNPPQSTSYIPTPATLAGNFSTFDGSTCISNGKSKQLTDPSASGAPFPNDQIPVNRFNSASMKLIPYLPENLIQNACGKVVYGVPNNSNEAQYVGRLDYVLSSKQTFFGRYLDDDYLLPPNWSATNILVTSSPGNAERAQTITLGDTYSFNQTSVNSAHASFSRRRDNRGPNSQDIDPTALGVNINPYTPSNFLQMGITGYFSVGCGTCGPGFFNSNTFQFADDIDLIRGKHQIAFGIDMVRTQNNLSSYHNADGNFTFSGTGVNSTGDAMADFQLGIMGASGFTFSKAQLQALRETIPGLYVQDTYRLNPQITISAGVRWEPMLFPQDIYGRGSIFSMPAYLAGQTSTVYSNAPAGSFYYGDPGVNKSFTNDKWTNFAPRLGLVWNPHGDGKQTLRVGAAVLYDTGQVYYSERVMTNPPFVDDTTLVNPGPFNNPWQGYPGGDPFPIPSPAPKNVVFPTSAAYVVLPQHLKTMYMTDWNISYQRQFAGNWLVTASYLGNKTTHLWLGLNLDYDVYIPGQSTTANATQRSILYLLNPKQGTYYSSLTMTDDGANSDYNGLLVSAQHRVSQHFSVLTNFTWSHCIGDGDFGGDIAGASYQIPTNRDADRGNCNYDYRRLMNTSIVAESPFKGRSWAARILGDWQVSPSLRLQSGGPLSISSGVNNSLTGGSGDRADPVPGASPYTSAWGPQLQMLNTAAFIQNPIGTYGTLGRDTIRGPGTITVNAAMVRFFRFKEPYRLETRFEAFNAVNRVNFSSPATSLTSATFGRITAAGDPRILQFAMKLHF